MELWVLRALSVMNFDTSVESGDSRCDLGDSDVVDVGVDDAAGTVVVVVVAAAVVVVVVASGVALSMFFWRSGAAAIEASFLFQTDFLAIPTFLPNTFIVL